MSDVLTKELARKAIDNLQAFIDGKPLETMIAGKWRPTTPASLPHESVLTMGKYYRLKKEPSSGWVVVNGMGKFVSGVYPNSIEPSWLVSRCPSYKVVKVAVVSEDT